MAQSMSGTATAVSNSGQASPKQIFKPLKVVQIEGSTLLKLIKYCGDTKTRVSGRLLGLQRQSTLEVTNCFPHHNGNFSSEINKEILQLMAEIRQDNFLVGWYLSSLNGNFLDLETIDRQYQLQANFSNAVCIVYDPTFSEKGRLVIRAFKLTKKFMDFYKNNEFGPTSIGEYDINSSNIFEEIDIKIHCQHLIHSFLFEIKDNKNLQCDFDRLHHSHSESLTNNLKQLSNNIELYSSETSSFRQYYSACTRVKIQRENFANQIYEENKKLKSRGLRTRPMPDLEKLYPSTPERSRIESILINSQMNQYTKEVELSTMQGLAKLWVTQGIHQNKPVNNQ